jgi:hypothetical protein
MDDLHRHLMEVAGQTDDLTEAAQLIDQDTVTRQVRHTQGRTREMLPRVEGALLHELVILGFEPDLVPGDDPLLAPMYLPEGWQRRRSDHHLYTYLVDGRGADRVMVMYKGGQYDRDAWMRVL